MIFRTLFLKSAAFRSEKISVSDCEECSRAFGFGLLVFGSRFFRCGLRNKTMVPRVARIHESVDYQLLWPGFNLGMCPRSQLRSGQGVDHADEVVRLKREPIRV
jgi:hypothetical protein